MKYDVIIVGTGPAGTSAALEFARKSDLHILVIDKETLPREKPCGGAMPSSVEKLLNINISKVIRNRTEVLKHYHNYEDEVVNKTPGKGAPILVNRSEFDMFLLEKAVDRSNGNIDVLEKCSVVSVKEDHGKVDIIFDNGKKLETKYLIAADGALSKIAFMMGLMKKRKFAQSFDAEIITTSEYYDDHVGTMVMNYFCLAYGYGWIFPKEKNRFSCGVGTWGKPLNLNRALKDFIVKSFPRDVIKNIKVTGYPIPIYQGVQKIATNRILLTGDAAGLVDPVSGEGIRFALHSGKIAADVITETLMGNIELLGNSVSDEYQKRINEEIEQELKAKLSFVSLAFHNSPAMFYKTFVKRV